MGRWFGRLGVVVVLATGACSGSSSHARATTTTVRRARPSTAAALRVVDAATGRVASTSTLGIPLVDKVAAGAGTVVVGGVLKAAQVAPLGAPCDRGRAVVLGVRNGKIAWTAPGSSLIGAEGPWVLTSRVTAGGRVFSDVRDVADGHVRWTSKGREGQATTLLGNTVLFDGSIVVGGHPSTVTGVVTAHDAASGQVLWRAPGLPAARLIATGDRVYALVGREFRDAASSELVALDARTGGVVWRVRDASLTPSLLHTTVVADGGVVVEELGGDADVNRGAVLFVGLAADSGRVLWKRSISAPGLVVTGDPAAHMAYGFGSGGPLYSIDPKTGAARSKPVIVPSVRDIVGADHGVAILAGNGSLVAVRARDGQVAWQRPGSHAVAATLAGGRLYIAESPLACFD